MPRVFSLWRNLVHRDRVGRDLDDEVRGTFDLLVAEKIQTGMRPGEARRAARQELGGVESVKEQVRQVRAGALVEEFVQDARYAARLLRRNPLFALTAALSLAIGIGANTAIFTIANALLFRAPVGVDDPDRLVDIVRTEDGGVTLGVSPLPYTTFLEIRRRTTSLAGVYGSTFDLAAASLETPDGTERIFAGVVTGNYFTVLGVPAAAGRLFGPGDSEQEGRSPLIVLSHRFWTRRFNADPAVVGQTLRINVQPLTVIGVAAEGFRGTSVLAPDVWVPAATAQVVDPGPYSLTNRSSTLQMALGARLKPGVSVSQAAAELDTLGLALQREFPPGPVPASVFGRELPNDGRRRSLGAVALTPIPGNLRVIVAGFLALLMGMVSIVLVIACANVAGVLLARAVARRRETAVRVALGAGRARLVRQLLTETLLLFVAGGAAGLLLARLMASLLVLVLPEFPRPVGLSLPLDGRAIVFTAGVSLVAALLSGLAPALQSAKADVVSALKADSQGPSDRLRLRSAFVVAQVALSMMLVVAAGLFARALQQTGTIDRGFEPRGVEVASLDLSMAGYTATTGPLFARELIDRVRKLPGVQAATLADRAPDGRMMINGGLTAPGVAPPDGRRVFMAGWNRVEPDYFTTLQIPLVAGRDFRDTDRAGAQPVAIVAEATARRLWPGEDPLGQYVVWEGGPPPFVQPSAATMMVVGVARDLKLDGPGGAESPLSVYVPLQQRYHPDMTILARRSDGQRFPNEIRSLVASMEPGLPMLHAQSLEARTGPVETQLRIAAAVSGSVGIVGLLLAAIGVYGVTAYTAVRRTREIGIRMAMGAQRADVVRMVLGHGMSLVVIGSAIGLALAAAGSRILASLLFGIPPLDPLTFGGAALLSVAIGLAACYAPARHATRIEAMEALRYE